MNRTEVLDKAKAAVADREGKYGHPRENFERIALRWQTHLVNRYGYGAGFTSLDAEDVAIMLADVKLARAESGVYLEDNFIDGAGYIALAAEVGAPHDQGSVNLTPSEIIEALRAGEADISEYLNQRRGDCPFGNPDCLKCYPDRQK
jgi:hypothetical protein